MPGLNPPPSPCSHTRAVFPALQRRQWSKIPTVTMQKIERINDQLAVIAPHGLPTGARSAAGAGETVLGIGRKCPPARPPSPATETRLTAVLSDLQAVAIEPRLVQPGVARRAQFLALIGCRGG
jgi:hypothetical protein